METDTKEEKTEYTHQIEEYKLSFKNGALKNLKRLAVRFGVPDDDLDEVVSKAVKLLTYVQDSKDNSVSFVDKKGIRYIVDIENL